MAYATTTINWTEEQVTSTKLDEIISGFRLASQSVDATTVTLSSGVLSVGVLGASNLGADSVTTVKILDANVTAAKLATDSVTTAKILADAVTAVKIPDATIPFAKTMTADRAVQADMQSETAAHFVSPDVMKYHPGVAKAYGRVSFVNATTTIVGGYNVTSATDTGSGRQITLAVTMANTSYTVIAIPNAGGAPVTYTINSATQFTLDGPAEGAGRELAFMVFGQLA